MEKLGNTVLTSRTAVHGEHSLGGNVGMIIYNQPIDVTYIDKIVMNCWLYTNAATATNYTTIGIAKSNASTAYEDFYAFDKSEVIQNYGPNLKKYTVELDVRDYTGFYYLKETTRHEYPDGLYHTSYTIIDNIYSVSSKNVSNYSLGYVTDGLVVHYDGIKNVLGEHSATTTVWKDLSGNGNDGILKGCTWNEDSLKFDGVDDYVLIGDHNYDQFTLEIVVLNDEVKTSETEYICNYEGGGYGLSYSGQKNLCEIYGLNSSAWKQLYSNNAIVPNKKYVITGSYNLNQITLFENGTKFQKSESDKIKTPNNDTKLCIGTNPSSNRGTACWLNGKVYSVRVYNRALTDEEVRKNYEIDKIRFGVE